MTDRRKQLHALQDRLDYQFADPDLLSVALTHVSALSPSEQRDRSYQRLEFLGDHVLGLVVSDMLYRAFPASDEGDLSRRLANLVRKETCAEAAADLDLAAALLVAPGEGGALAARQSVMSDACESVIGAVFLDGGYAAAAALIERLWRDRMRAAGATRRDSKTLLQEWAQARGKPPPHYAIVSQTGPAHSPQFRVRVELPGYEPQEGTGPSRRAAEQAAATAMLEREGAVHDRA